MKTILVIFLVVILSAGTQLQAARPIPSYKAPVSKAANFREKDQKNDVTLDPKGKRNMIIVSNVIGPARLPAFFWVYSLDMQDVLGPFVIYGDGTLTVPIDDRPWGVLMECFEKTIVSVWTTPVMFE